MYFHEVEVVELGAAENLIQDVDDLDTSESFEPTRIKNVLAIYIADAE